MSFDQCSSLQLIASLNCLWTHYSGSNICLLPEVRDKTSHVSCLLLRTLAGRQETAHRRQQEAAGSTQQRRESVCHCHLPGCHCQWMEIFAKMRKKSEKCTKNTENYWIFLPVPADQCATVKSVFTFSRILFNTFSPTFLLKQTLIFLCVFIMASFLSLTEAKIVALDFPLEALPESVDDPIWLAMRAEMHLNLAEISILKKRGRDASGPSRQCGPKR